MKDKFNYNQCIRRKCDGCKRYDICFGYKPKGEKKKCIKEYIQKQGK